MAGFDSSFFDDIKWYHKLAIDHNKKFMLNLDWQNLNRNGTNGNWSFDIEEVQIKFKEDVLELANTYEPDVFVLGVEVNYYALIDSSGFKGFINAYNSVKSILDKEFPNIEIGLSYQLELLYGVHKDWGSNKVLESLNAVVQNMDFIGVSTYPIQHDFSVQDITGSLPYLDSLKEFYEVPLKITETAVSSEEFDQNQRNAYTKEIFEKVNSLGVEFLSWGSMIDHPYLESWHHQIGLLKANGSPKNEFSIWVEESRKIRSK